MLHVRWQNEMWAKAKYPHSPLDQPCDAAIAEAKTRDGIPRKETDGISQQRHEGLPANWTEMRRSSSPPSFYFFFKDMSTPLCHREMDWSSARDGKYEIEFFRSVNMLLLPCRVALKDENSSDLPSFSLGRFEQYLAYIN